MGTLGTRMIAVSAVVGAAAVTGLAAPQALAAEPGSAETVLAASLNGANEVPMRRHGRRRPGVRTGQG